MILSDVTEADCSCSCATNCFQLRSVPSGKTKACCGISSSSIAEELENDKVFSHKVLLSDQIEYVAACYLAAQYHDLIVLPYQGEARQIVDHHLDVVR